MIKLPHKLSLNPCHLEPAEICLYSRQPEKVGFRYMLLEWSDVEALAHAISLPRIILTDEKRIRQKFDITQGYWIKIGCLDGAPKTYSQYFAITIGHFYPAATLRLFLKMYGASDGKRIVKALDNGLNEKESIWNLAIKRDSNTTSPRIYGRIGRHLLKPILDDLVRAELTSAEYRDRYLSLDRNVTAGDQIYLSIDPGPHPAVAVDYEEAPAKSLPFSADEFGVSLPSTSILPYLKCRLKRPDDKPEWVAHLSWPWFRSTFGSQLEQDLK